jgi:lysozyme
MVKRVIDVSKHQSVIDWDKVKNHIDGAILRCGYGMDLIVQDDKQFERNASECERLGIPYGVYLYSYATNDENAKSEAGHILRLIKGKKLSLPVYLDVEEETPEHRKYAPRACEIVGDIITKAGYTFGVYANLNWWKNYLKGVNKYTRWVAQYNNKCTYTGKCDMWQYSSSGNIEGINGRVDMNECYLEFGPVEITKSVDELAHEVINGVWGTGEERKARLTDAGYDYTSIQKRVNEILKSATPSSVVYTVKKGDTLGAIAIKYNVTVNQIVRLNGIKDANKIYVGQKLKIK